MDNLKYFPFYYSRFADGVRGYSMQFVGCYMMLLCRQAELQRIPKDMVKLSRWMGGVELGLIEEVLKEKFLEDNDGFYNLTLETVLKDVSNKSESARRSAFSRWEKIRLESERNANASETHPKTDANDMLESKVNEIKENINNVIFFEKSIKDEGWKESVMKACRITNPDVWVNQFKDHVKAIQEVHPTITKWRRHCVYWINAELRKRPDQPKPSRTRRDATHG